MDAENQRQPASSAPRLVRKIVSMGVFSATWAGIGIALVALLVLSFFCFLLMSPVIIIFLIVEIIDDGYDPVCNWWSERYDEGKKAILPNTEAMRIETEIEDGEFDE